MALFPLFKKDTTVQRFNTTFIPLDYIQSFLSQYDNVGDNKLLKYYLQTPELQAIINYRAKLFSDMRVIAMKNEKEIEIPFLDVLRSPNPLQPFREFAKQCSINKDVFGNVYINPIFGVDKKKTTMLWNMPSQNAEIKKQPELKNPFQKSTKEEIIKEYIFKFDDLELKYPADEIIHFNDNQIKTNKEWLKGHSRIATLSQACENIITAYEVRGILTGNAPLGIITDSTKDPVGFTPMTEQEKKIILEEMRKYGTKAGKYQYIVTRANLDFKSMAINLSNLKLFEEVDNDQSAIADAFSFPVEIFQNNVTFENKKEAKKQLYQDSIIPEANEWLQGLAKELGFHEQGITLIADYSHVQVLQDDMAERSRMWTLAVNALNKAFQDGAITMDEYRDNLTKINIL